MSRLRNPWPDGYTINKRSPYGYRIHPISGARKFHHGVDVAGRFPVTAAADGRVMKIGWSPSGGGHTVLIDHRDIVTVYYHGAHRTALAVGQEVKAGDFIYTSGNTGASTGAHLHFEVRGPGGKWGDTYNPEDFLPRPGQKPTMPVTPPAPPVAPQPQPAPITPEAVVRPPQPVVKPPAVSAQMLAKLKQKFAKYPRRGWF